MVDDAVEGTSGPEDMRDYLFGTLMDIDEADQWLKLGGELRPAERNARQALAEQAARDLGHR